MHKTHQYVVIWIEVVHESMHFVYDVYRNNRFHASLHRVLTSVTFWGKNTTHGSVDPMFNSVFSHLCVDYVTGNNTMVLRSPVKPGMMIRIPKLLFMPQRYAVFLFAKRKLKVYQNGH